MEEQEYNFQCPFCLETISMILDLSVEDPQSYIEDCEVCCNPIQISYRCENNEVSDFSASKAYE